MSMIHVNSFSLLKYFLHLVPQSPFFIEIAAARLQHPFTSALSYISIDYSDIFHPLEVANPSSARLDID